jgi:ATPase family associated with various cellular activities (AAA)
MATGILSHYRAGTGAVAVETREEKRFVLDLLAELPEEVQVLTCAAPSGDLRDARTGIAEQGQKGLAAGYAWGMNSPGRVLVVWDWHVLANAPGHWRSLLEALPGLRQPKGAGENDPASLVIFVGPAWNLEPHNPLRGGLPVLSYAPPDRDSIRDTLERLHPLNGDAEACVDALCGLTADSAEQAAAEVLARNGGKYDPALLREAKRGTLRQAGLDTWPAVANLGGLSGLRSYCDNEVIPWLRDPQLAVRRLLMAGIPGVGKSYCARWLAHRIGAECCRLSIPALKAGVVGASEANLRRALGMLDAMGKYAPLVVVLDEIDTIARDGMDGGTSSGMFAELLTWLQESTSQAVVIATLNRLDKLDAALESRFQARFFFDLPSHRERLAVAEIHYQRLGCEEVPEAARITADYTDGFASREIAEHVAPSVARQSNRKPTSEIIAKVCAGVTPASRTQGEQLQAMRRAASTLRRANDPEEMVVPGRRIVA